MLMLVLRRLTQPIGEGLTELKPLLLLVVVAALYTSHEIALRALAEIAPDHPNPLDYVCDELLACSKDIKGVHNRKMALFGICAFFNLPRESRPSTVNTNPQKVIDVAISIFDNLQRTLKAQAENRNEDDSDSDSDEESDDDVDTTKKKKSLNRRKLPEHLSDDDDEIDELTFDYIDAMSKDIKTFTGGNFDDDGSGESGDGTSFCEETDTEQFKTAFDEDTAPDVFVYFKNTMEKFEQAEPEIFQNMVHNLTTQQSTSLKELITICEQHVKSEESKQVEQAGGYDFKAAAAVPTEFNFAK
ncbi:hypothetical protein TELCIR_03042 [Teladorsagia circumcincta]|uniref:Uncharacterized protein n=1 Tax=Teladorsagia circumcincta TaxID=45464 RepID=A0A2G9UXE8_TELCI|nr:hypothetical protein TELCIR_03042 [Teladorsagia circumcincta]